MFENEEKIRKNVITPNQEDEFQIRYIRAEDVGIITSRSDKSYFILDSNDYWYDLIQEQYPSKQKCSCKNDYFKVSFDYIPRKGTDDFKAVELTSQCTECGKIKKFARIDIDYSPSCQLYDSEITFCPQPNIKYKTHTINGFWKTKELYDLIAFLASNQLFIYMCYWGKTDHKRYFDQFSYSELIDFLSSENSHYLNIYFTMEPLTELSHFSGYDDKGIYIVHDIWRKKEIIEISSPIRIFNSPIHLAFGNVKDLYCMRFCSEYIDTNGKIQTKSDEFCRLTEEVLKYRKKHLK